MTTLNEFEGKKKWSEMTDEEKHTYAKNLSDQLQQCRKESEQSFAEGDALLELLKRSGVVRDIE